MRVIDAGYVFEDDNGNPLSGGRVYFYTSGTATLKATYSDIARTVQNANPLTISAGAETHLHQDAPASSAPTVPRHDPKKTARTTRAAGLMQGHLPLSCDQERLMAHLARRRGEGGYAPYSSPPRFQLFPVPSRAAPKNAQQSGGRHTSPT